MNPERIFVIFSLIFGLAFIGIIPPFQVFDEAGHFLRAYQISSGGLVAHKDGELVGGVLPKSLRIVTALFDDMRFRSERKFNAELFRQALRIPLQKNDTIFLDFPNTAVHAPAAYLPQACGISVGKLLNLPPLVLMYLGRLANLAVWIFLVFFSIQKTPLLKWTFLLLSLTPMALYEASSLSADGFTNGLAFFIIATCLEFSYAKRTVNRKDLALFLVLAILLAFSKYVYFLIPLLFFLVPVSKLGSRRKYLTYCGSLVMVLLVCVFLWSLIIKRLYVPIREGTDAFRQLSFILENPVQYFLILWNTYSRFW